MECLGGVEQAGVEGAQTSGGGLGCDGRPRGGGARDQVALAVRDVEVGETFELLQRLDAFGADGRIDVPRVADEGADQRSLGRVAVDAGRQRAVELDDVRLQPQEVDQAGVAGPGVVDGESGTAGAQGGERVVDGGIAGDELVLGDLHHQVVQAAGEGEPDLV
jgi:hypothetical protein